MKSIVMGEWQELAQSVFIGLIFSFLVAKLISMVISFRDDNLRIVHEDNLPVESVEPESKPSNVESTTDSKQIVADSGISNKGKSSLRDADSGVAEKQNLVGEGLDEGDEDDEDEDDDDDWEGVESTELDEVFSAASAFVATAAADREKVSNDVQLQLYGFYKIATEGPCTVSQPSALKISARAKWNAWQRLGAMPPEEAMQKYIVIVNELYPSWAAGLAIKSKGGDSGEPTSSAKGPVGPVFSTFVYEEGSDNELKMEAIHASAREGEIDNLLKYIENGISVNLKDSEGRTPLHWAVDRGHQNVVEWLVSRNADVNAQDNDGQTPLHYAVVCEREAIAEFLVKQNADRDLKDKDGESPSDLCDLAAWKWMRPNN